MSLLAALVSNRPQKAKTALESYSQNEDETPNEWLIVAPKRFEKDMTVAVRLVGGTLLVEEEFRDALPKPLQEPFVGGFGCFRNMALACAAKEKKNVVFVDDDTRPENDVFRRHAGFLTDAGIGIGKYNGHVGGASSTLLDLTHALEKFDDSRLERQEFETLLELRLRGVPPEQKPVEHAGAVGGNLGINWKTARKQAFCTLPYRVEDGTFAALCQDKVVNPSVSRSPLVRHEKQGRLNGLFEELAGDCKGNALAAYIVGQIRGQKNNVEELAAQVRKGLLLDYFAEKYRKTVFRHSELDRLRDLRADISKSEAEQAAEEYLKVQNVWAECWEACG